MSTFCACEEWIAKYKWLELKHDTFSNLYHKLSQEWLKYFLSQRIPFTALLAEGCNSNLSRGKYLPDASCSRGASHYANINTYSPALKYVVKWTPHWSKYKVINIPSLKWLFQNCLITIWFFSKWKCHYKYRNQDLMYVYFP